MTKKIIQVAGYSNSGKTTLVEKLVKAATSVGHRVGTIKHHGHGGELTSLDEGKDSWKHRQAGATVAGAVSKGTLQLNVTREDAWEADELVALYSSFPIDVIVVEGFKSSPFPKVVIIKEEEDLKLLTKLETIFCVISWFPLSTQQCNAKDIMYFQLDDEEKYLTFLLEKLKGYDND